MTKIKILSTPHILTHNDALFYVILIIFHTLANTISKLPENCA
jgi:hypothetical protein